MFGKKKKEELKIPEENILQQQEVGLSSREIEAENLKLQKKLEEIESNLEEYKQTVEYQQELEELSNEKIYRYNLLQEQKSTNDLLRYIGRALYDLVQLNVQKAGLEPVGEE